MTRRVMALIVSVAVFILGCFLTALGLIMNPIYRVSEWLGRQEDELDKAELFKMPKPRVTFLLIFKLSDDLVKDWRNEDQIRSFDHLWQAIGQAEYYAIHGIGMTYPSHLMKIYMCQEGEETLLVASYKNSQVGWTKDDAIWIHEEEGRSSSHSSSRDYMEAIRDPKDVAFGDGVEDNLSDDELRYNQERWYGKLKNDKDYAIRAKSRSHTGKEKRRGKRKDDWG